MSNINMLKKQFPSVYDFIINTNLKTCNLGTYNLENGIYVNVESYRTQSIHERRYEMHRRYIDIQYMITGAEYIYLCDVNNLKLEQTYNQDKDIMFYTNNAQGEKYLISDGQYLIIEADRPHMPCVCVEEPSIVKKAVFKCPIKK